MSLHQTSLPADLIASGTVMAAALGATDAATEAAALAGGAALGAADAAGVGAGVGAAVGAVVAALEHAPTRNSAVNPMAARVRQGAMNVLLLTSPDLSHGSGRPAATRTLPSALLRKGTTSHRFGGRP